MRKLLVVMLVLIPVILMGQASPTSRLGWDQSAISLDEAYSFTYRIYIDNGEIGVILAGVNCSESQPTVFFCSAALPAMGFGSHRVQLTAANVSGESAKSSPFDFVFGSGVVPSAPRGLRIIGG